MRLDIRYRTRFEYDAPVHESQNELRAAPMSDPRQLLISYRVATIPASRVFSFTDYWGTRVDAFGVREPHAALDVVAEASVETRRAPLLTASPPIDSVIDSAFRDEHLEYLQPTPHADWGRGVADEARRELDRSGPDLMRVVLALHRRVASSIRYEPGSTYVGVEVEEVLARRVGVCQDFAHLAIAMCRSVGIPARYVSGYLFTTNDATGDDPDADAVRVQTHAWFEAAVPGGGWLALDPTNATEVGLRHVKIGHGRDYNDVPPLRGVFSGSAEPSLGVSVDIRRLGTSAADAARSAAAAQQRLDEARARRARLAHQAQQAQQ
ncbi:MAG TPA: transglutaminase family protein [Acidimicrobiales bacterium]|nr:transglutaminase family protein [Acidimicrobiales bacterium]